MLQQGPIPEAFRAGGGVSTPVADGWLASFEEPALTTLVNEALAYNADLQVAAARVEQAAGYVKVASGGLLPSVGVAALGGDKSGGGGGLNGVFLNASLELDVWGRLRYESAASREQLAAAEADYAYARQSLAAMVAKSWFLAVEAGMQRAIAKDSLSSSEGLMRLADDRLRIGNGTALSSAQARASVNGYRDTLKQVELSREQAVRALELLVGRYPGAEIAVADQLSRMPPPLPVGVPSEVLERRPDMVAAERRVAAAFNRVGEAKAAQLPKIRPTAGGSNVSERTDRPEGRQQPGVEPGREPDRTDLPGRRAAGPGRDPVGRAEAGSGRVRARRSEGVQRGRDRAGHGVDPARTRGRPRRPRSATTRRRCGWRGFSTRWARRTCARSSRASWRSMRRGRRGCGCRAEQLAQRANLYLALGGGVSARWRTHTQAARGQRPMRAS